MSDILNRSWLALNLGRSYPTVPWGTQVDTTNTFTIPNDLIAELVLPISSGVQIDQTKLLISSITSYPSGYSLSVGYAGTTPITVVATATVTAAALAASDFVPTPLAGVGAFADTIGRVVWGSQRGVLLQPPGMYSFTLAASQLDLDCVQPQMRGVTALYVQNGVSTVGPIYGDVTFAAGTNFQLNFGSTGLQLNAVSGAGLSESCTCDSSPSPATPITAINGIPASAANGFTIQGDSCIDVSTVAGGFSLKDLCSSPCCGPVELAAIEAELSQFASEVATLRQFISSLQAVQAATNTNLLASKIGDQGCLSCS